MRSPPKRLAIGDHFHDGHAVDPCPNVAAVGGVDGLLRVERSLAFSRSDWQIDEQRSLRDTLRSSAIGVPRYASSVIPFRDNSVRRIFILFSNAGTTVSRMCLVSRHMVTAAVW